eukprot:TRINITY_DN811_c2_g2_i1.p1 TRINITY_DN811_c2_g2~~TRINITY_DN811_c2_g2_i1.p1  ORF type:complete len:827 (+),score=315.23 TRINITY_DN811_c2_g2_i1:60-2540(+)
MAAVGKPDRKRKKQKPVLSFGMDEEEEVGARARKRRKAGLVNREAVAEFSGAAETTEERLRRQAGDRYGKDELARLMTENRNENARPPPQAAAGVEEFVDAGAIESVPLSSREDSRTPTPPPVPGLAFGGGGDADPDRSVFTRDEIRALKIERRRRQAHAGDDPDDVPADAAEGLQRPAGGDTRRGRLHAMASALKAQRGDVLDQEGSATLNSESVDLYAHTRARGPRGRKEAAWRQTRLPSSEPASEAEDEAEGGGDSFIAQQLQRARGAYIPSLDESAKAPRGRRAAASASPVPDVAARKEDTTIAAKVEKNVLSLDLPSFDDQMAKLRHIAARMRATREAAAAEDSQLRQTLTVCEASLQEYREKAAATTSRFHVLQEMRDYFEALAGCLQHKRGEIDRLVAKSLAHRAARHAGRAAKRRAWRVDEDGEVALVVHHHRCEAGAASEHPGVAIDAAWATRSTQRHMEYENDCRSSEEAAAAPHCDAFAAEAAQIMADVDEGFGTLAAVRAKLESWQKQDAESYAAAARPSLAVCYEPFVKLSLASWDPLSLTAPYLPHLPWWEGLAGPKDGKAAAAEAGLRGFLVQEVVVPYVEKYVADCYDPLSGTQGKVLVALVAELRAAMDGNPDGARPVTEAAAAALRRGFADFAPFEGLQEVHEGEEVVVAAAAAAGGKVIHTRTMALAASANRCRKVSELLGNVRGWGGVLPERTACDLILREGVCGTLCPHLLTHPRGSFPFVAAATEALADELAKVPPAWVAASDDEAAERTAGIRVLMDALSDAFRRLRSSDGRAAHREMIAAAKSFKRVCDALGDHSTIKRILG